MAVPPEPVGIGCSGETVRYPKVSTYRDRWDTALCRRSKERRALHAVRILGVLKELVRRMTVPSEKYRDYGRSH